MMKVNEFVDDIHTSVIVYNSRGYKTEQLKARRERDVVGLDAHLSLQIVSAVSCL